jgi:hypothetical protein
LSFGLFRFEPKIFLVFFEDTQCEKAFLSQKENFRLISRPVMKIVVIVHIGEGVALGGPADVAQVLVQILAARLHACGQEGHGRARPRPPVSPDAHEGVGAEGGPAPDTLAGRLDEQVGAVPREFKVHRVQVEYLVVTHLE